jgi:hypothetical protein
MTFVLLLSFSFLSEPSRVMVLVLASYFSILPVTWLSLVAEPAAVSLEPPIAELLPVPPVLEPVPLVLVSVPLVALLDPVPLVLVSVPVVVLLDPVPLALDRVPVALGSVLEPVELLPDPLLGELEGLVVVPDELLCAWASGAATSSPASPKPAKMLHPVRVMSVFLLFRIR